MAATPHVSPFRRSAEVGMTALLVMLHAGAGLVGWWWGWPWGLAALAGLVLGLTACTLYPHCRWFGSATRRIPCTTRSVVLTIDDGPCDDTAEILGLLEKHQARAVFFLIGERAARRPDDVRRIVAAGHLLGNHTYTHPRFWYWAYPPWLQRREVRRCQQVLTEITGRVPRGFRAPAGLRNPYCNLVASEAGLEVVGWQARGLDGVPTPVERVLARLRRGLCPGAILLVHQGMPNSPEVLRRVLEMLAAEGWSTILPDAWLNPPAAAGTPPASC